MAITRRDRRGTRARDGQRPCPARPASGSDCPCERGTLRAERTSRHGTLATEEGGTLRNLIVLMFCLQLGVAGCAMRGGGRASANQRGERLAIERGRLSELADPVARTKSYIVISDLLLSFAADAAREQAHDDFRGLLMEYGRTIRTARETIVNSERRPDREPQGYTDLEGALRRQVQTLQGFRRNVDPRDEEPLDQGIQVASSIREEMKHLLSR